MYNGIVQYLTIEGYPMEGDPDFKESNISRLVYATIGPILSDFIRKTGRVAVQLWSEKEIVPTDSETGGAGGFAALDLVSVKEGKAHPHSRGKEIFGTGGGAVSAGDERHERQQW